MPPPPKATVGRTSVPSIPEDVAVDVEGEASTGRAVTHSVTGTSGAFPADLHRGVHERGGDDDGVETLSQTTLERSITPRSVAFWSVAPEVNETSGQPSSLANALAISTAPGNWCGGSAGSTLFKTFFVMCLLATASMSGLAIALWSSAGCDLHCLRQVQDYAGYRIHCLCIVAIILLVLYLFDFFRPPHLPKQYLVLYDGDRYVGRALLGVAAVLLLLSGFLSAKEMPTAPLGLTIFLSPLSILFVRHVTVVYQLASEREEKFSDELCMTKSFHERVNRLQRIGVGERSDRAFYLALMYAFLISGSLSLIVFICWSTVAEDHFRARARAIDDKREKELVFIMWGAPLLVAFSNFVFALFTGLRVALNEAYSATDQVKNQLVVGELHAVNAEIMQHRTTTLNQYFEEVDRHREEGGAPLQASPSITSNMGHMRTSRSIASNVPHFQAQDRMQRFLVQHISHMKQLSNLVKSMGCCFIVMLGALHIAFQLTASGSYAAAMVQEFLSLMFLTYAAFVYVSFNRIFRAMQGWLRELPLWATAVSLSRSMWTKAAVLTLALPLVPCVFLLSCANQQVRRLRGLPLHPRADLEQRAVCFGLLTRRVQDHLASVLEWDPVDFFWRCYVVALIVLIWKLIPLFLNIFLSSLKDALGSSSFFVTMVAIYLVGLFLFLLPPIPGPPIYLFGGLMLSDRCPLGFWWGSLSCVLLCAFLKMSACAVQQQIIGLWLGDKPWVRQTVGVHKPLIRAIEVILRKPGLSFGKCMILCGGPDWPTSVLAGILKLSLFQCLLGTTPIMANLIPLCLTGSFYLRRSENTIWMRAGDLMFSLTVTTSVIFWSGMAWAIQNEMENNHEALTAVKPEHVDLLWLEHRTQVIKEKCKVNWAQVPVWIRVPYVVGVSGMLLVATAITWRKNSFFGEFAVTDPIDELVWTGEGGVVKPPGEVASLMACVCWTGFLIYEAWERNRRRAPARQAAIELEAIEARWKADLTNDGGRMMSRHVSNVSSENASRREWLRATTSEDFAEMLEECEEVARTEDAGTLPSSSPGGAPGSSPARSSRTGPLDETSCFPPSASPKDDDVRWCEKSPGSGSSTTQKVSFATPPQDSTLLRSPSPGKDGAAFTPTKRNLGDELREASTPPSSRKRKTTESPLSKTSGATPPHNGQAAPGAVKKKTTPCWSYCLLCPGNGIPSV